MAILILFLMTVSQQMKASISTRSFSFDIILSQDADFCLSDFGAFWSILT